MAILLIMIRTRFAVHIPLVFYGSYKKIPDIAAGDWIWVNRKLFGVSDCH